MGWGKEWPVEIIPPTPLVDQQWSSGALLFKEMSKEEVLKQWPDAKIPVSEQPIHEFRELNNLKPTHDPYTNPNALIYYECGCGAILDPKTKSFAALNNAASVAGWKVRFGEVGYTPYCPKCGEGVE